MVLVAPLNSLSTTSMDGYVPLIVWAMKYQTWWYKQLILFQTGEIRSACNAYLKSLSTSLGCCLLLPPRHLNRAQRKVPRQDGVGLTTAPEMAPIDVDPSPTFVPQIFISPKNAPLLQSHCSCQPRSLPFPRMFTQVSPFRDRSSVQNKSWVLRAISFVSEKRLVIITRDTQLSCKQYKWFIHRTIYYCRQSYFAFNSGKLFSLSHHVSRRSLL